MTADVLRIDKGHAGNLEPKAMDALVILMVQAPGGKVPALG